MAKMKTMYLPSTREGYHWQVSCDKMQGRPGYALAIEGKLGFREDGSPSSFQYELYGSTRSHRVPVNGRMTKGNMFGATQAMIDTMAAGGLIPREERCPMMEFMPG